MSAAGGAGTAAGTATSALCLLLSLTAVAVCLLLGAKTAELQGRLAALEERGAAGPGPLLDALQPRLEQLLREKLGEGLAKLRTAREAPSDCMCPPEVAKDGRKMCTALMVENALACYKALQAADSSILVLKEKKNECYM